MPIALQRAIDGHSPLHLWSESLTSRQERRFAERSEDMVLETSKQYNGDPFRGRAKSRFRFAPDLRCIASISERPRR